MSSEVLDEIGRLVDDDGAYFVGGCVRDVRLGLPVTDVDVVVPGDPATVARRLARETGGSPFALSEAHGAWRVVLDGRTLDITAPARGRYRGRPGRARLHRERDGDPGRRRGDGDVSTRSAASATWRRAGCGLVSDRVFTDDPLRLLRLARIAHELGFEVDSEAERLARRDAHLADRAAGERIYAEVRRLMTPDHPDAAVRLLDGLGVLDVILPEAAPMHGCEQSPFHHLDVFEHTLQVLDASADIAAHPEHYLPRHAEALRAALDQTVGDELDARTALRLAVLFHDIEKPSTRTVSDDGRIGFMGHDRKGAETAAADPQALARRDLDDPVLRPPRRRAPAAWLHGARPADRPPRRLPLPRGHGSRTPMRASSCRSPTGSPPAACARASRTCAPTPRRPTSCSRWSPSSSPRIARRCFAATRSPR